MDLYALPPEEFTAARDAAAKDDRSLKALRRPTVSAWVVNTLVRQEPDLLDQLLDLGAELGQAQQQGDAAALRQLGDQRRQLVAAVASRAVELVDRDVTAAVRGEVEATLEAALADPPSAEAVRTGQLVRPLAFAGFGGVDLEGAVADLPAVPKQTAPKKKAAAEKASKEAASSKRVQKLEAAALDAQGALDDAVRHAERVARDLEQAESKAAEAQQELAQHEEAVEQARQALAHAEKAQAAARTQHSRAAKEADELTRKAERATTSVARAQEAADAARKALDAARRA